MIPKYTAKCFYIMLRGLSFQKMSSTIYRPQWDRFPARLDINMTAQLHRLASELENCTKKLGM